MAGLFDTGVSIEKMAAFLEGNLQPEEMRAVSSIIDSNEELHGFIDQSNAIDDTLSKFTESDLTLPEELQSDTFELPSLEESDSDLGNTMFDDMIIPTDMMVACCAPDDGIDLMNSDYEGDTEDVLTDLGEINTSTDDGDMDFDN